MNLPYRSMPDSFKEREPNGVLGNLCTWRTKERWGGVAPPLFTPPNFCWSKELKHLAYGKGVLILLTNLLLLHLEVNLGIPFHEEHDVIDQNHVNNLLNAQ